MKNQSILDKCDVVLDANAPDFAEHFRAAIGVGPNDPVEIITPQFTRTDGIVPSLPQVKFSELPSLPADTLRAIGCQKWDEPDANGETLWLYPHDWYDVIPDGTPIIDINGEKEVFKRGETDDDMRFGALAFGFMSRSA